MVRLGEARQGEYWFGTAGKVWSGQVWCVKAGSGVFRRGEARHGRRGKVVSGMLRSGKLAVRQGWVRYGRCGEVR